MYVGLKSSTCHLSLKSTLEMKFMGFIVCLYVALIVQEQLCFVFFHVQHKNTPPLKRCIVVRLTLLMFSHISPRVVVRVPHSI